MTHRYIYRLLLTSLFDYHLSSAKPIFLLLKNTNPFKNEFGGRRLLMRDLGTSCWGVLGV